LLNQLAEERLFFPPLKSRRLDGGIHPDGTPRPALQIACYCCGAELVLMFELVLLLTGLLALFSMLLPPGVVAPP
jgi:hypothetical protein